MRYKIISETFKVQMQIDVWKLILLKEKEHFPYLIEGRDEEGENITDAGAMNGGGSIIGDDNY